MSENSLIINATANNGAKLSKSITDINPDASNADLNAFAEGIYALTNNTVSAVTKVTKEELTNRVSPLNATTPIYNLDNSLHTYTVDISTLTVTANVDIAATETYPTLAINFVSYAVRNAYASNCYAQFKIQAATGEEYASPPFVLIAASGAPELHFTLAINTLGSGLKEVLYGSTILITLPALTVGDVHYEQKIITVNFVQGA